MKTDVTTGTSVEVDLTPVLNNQKDLVNIHSIECILLFAILIFLAFDKVFGRFK